MARLVKFSNNAVSRLAGNITNVATSISLTPGDGAKFPALAAGEYFFATLVKSDGSLEIVKVTARASDTLTIQRAAEPVAGAAVAYAFTAGDKVELRMTSGALSSELDRLEARSPANDGTGATGTWSIDITGNAGSASTVPDNAITTAKINNLAVTTGKLADTSVTTGKLADAAVTRAKAGSDLLGVNPNTQSSSYTLALTDNGGHVYSTNAGAQTITIPTNASVAFPVGAAITLVNNGTTNITISTTGITLKQAGTTNTGNRTLATAGMATLLKVATDTWFISGAGLT